MGLRHPIMFKATCFLSRSDEVSFDAQIPDQNKDQNSGGKAYFDSQSLMGLYARRGKADITCGVICNFQTLIFNAEYPQHNSGFLRIFAKPSCDKARRDRLVCDSDNPDTLTIFVVESPDTRVRRIAKMLRCAVLMPQKRGMCML